MPDILKQKYSIGITTRNTAARIAGSPRASRNAEASHTGLCHTSNDQDNEDRADDKYRGLLEKNVF